MSAPTSTPGSGGGESSPAFPELSPFGPDSLRPSPQNPDMVPRTEATIAISELTPASASERIALHSTSSSSCGEDQPTSNEHDATPDGNSAHDVGPGNHDGSQGRTTPTLPVPADHRCCVLLSKLAEGVKTSQVYAECSKFGTVNHVYLPRRRAHPVFGVAAFVTFASEDVAARVIKVFNQAGYQAEHTAPPQRQQHHTRRRRNERTSYRHGSNSSTTDSRPGARQPLTMEEVRRLGEDRRRQQQLRTQHE